MPVLAQKLGIRSGQRVCLLDAPREAAALLQREMPEGMSFSETLDSGRYDVIMFWPAQLGGLAERFGELQRRIVPDGAIWTVIPKVRYAGARGVDFCWEEMQAAALKTDLVDNKTASLSEEEYGTRFVIRKERRGRYT